MSKLHTDNHPSIQDLKITVSDGGIIKSIPALDPFWVEKRELALYTNLTNAKHAFGVVETWKEQAKWVLDDLKWLLSMPHHKFWSHIVYYPPCMNLLVSFLQESNPPYQTPHDDKFVNELNDQIYHKVLVIFSRLITNKESPTEWIDQKHLGNLIYDKFIFTIPIIWDLCLLYGCNNKNVVSKIIKIIFQLQPKYNEDLKIAIDFLVQVFSFIMYKIDKKHSCEVPVLSEKFKGFNNSFGGLQDNSKKTNNEDISLENLTDLSLHLLDAVITIRILLDLHPLAREFFMDRKFHMSILNIYEGTIPLMYEKVANFTNAQNKVNETFSYLDNSRVELLDIFRMILETPINNIMSGSSNIENAVNSYLLVITDSLAEKIFLKDYNSFYPIDVDLDILCSAYPKIDPLKCDFILEAIRSCNEQDFQIPEFSDEDDEIPPVNHNGIHTEMSQNPVSSIPEDVKLQSLISEVRDILPHLGDGFIKKCLEFYGFNSELVINSILEGHLDESLQHLDQSLPIIPEDPLDAQYLKTGIDRLNVYDNDEFDVMARDEIDVSKVHKGKKKSKHKNLSDMLNDKSYIKKMKERYTKYSMVSDAVDMYDDEYDDTYDSVAPDLVSEAMTEFEKNPNIKKIESESDDEEPSEIDSSRIPSSSAAKQDAFCANPEEIRAKRQARFESKFGHSQSTNRDVVGRAKGQGQEKEVLLNRQNKGAQKSTRANHNRRTGAQWKRNQGML